MPVLLSITLFLAAGAAFVLVNLTVGAIVRPRVPNAEKASVYECGERPMGSSWIQFDLRFYIVALVFLVFDVEVALFYPWAVAYGSAQEMATQLSEATGRVITAFDFRLTALVDMLFFFGVLMVGYAYLWRFGYLDWVRSAATTSLQIPRKSGADLSRLARIDPNYAEVHGAETHREETHPEAIFSSGEEVNSGASMH